MRVFLVQTAHGLDSPSGGYKSNYGFINQLRGYGHAVAQTCYAFDEEIDECAAKAKDNGINPEVCHLPSIDFGRNPTTGLAQRVRVTKFVDENQILNIAISRHLWVSHLGKEVTAETKAYIEGNDPSSRMANLINMYSTQIAEFQPTHVVFNDGLTMKITEQMLRSAGPQSTLKFKRVCVVHSAEQLPFGPFCGGLSGHCLSADSENEMMKGLDGIWSVSKGIRDYALTHGNLQTSFFVHSTWTYLDEGNIPMRRNNADKTEVGLINACALKGLPIFVELAKRLPHIQFVAWMTWGSKQVYIDQLRELPNVRIENATKNTERDIWDRVKVLLVPSLWNEAWGAVITEAQLRGIPVMASNAGGIPEAKVGVPYLLPVNGLTGATDPKTGEYIIPKQDITPWEEALVKLMARDTSEYEQLSDYTARKTVQWIRDLDHRAQEKWLLAM